MTHGDECRCRDCAAKRVRHDEMVAEMQETCPGCKVGQPYESHGWHTETGDLYPIECEAGPIRKKMDEAFAEGTLLRRHGFPCDCSLCAEDRNLWKTGEVDG